jgi:hypothetical protein
MPRLTTIFGRGLGLVEGFRRSISPECSSPPRGFRLFGRTEPSPIAALIHSNLGVEGLVLHVVNPLTVAIYVLLDVFETEQHLVFGQGLRPSAKPVSLQTVPAGDCAHRIAARRDLSDDPNLLFMKPDTPAARSREHFNPLRGPGASIVSCDHSKPSGSNQPLSSQINTSFGR